MDKYATMKAMLGDSTIADSALLPYINLAEQIVLAKRYPFGYEDGTDVPSKYERVQILIAVELWNRRGAEGEKTHNENGINRAWADSVVSPTVLAMIMPYAGSVTNEDA